MLLDQPHSEFLPKMQLAIVSGALKGKTFNLRQGTYKIGRGKACDIVLKDTTISTKHAVVQYEKKNKVVFHDAGSTNGISKNGKKKQSILARDGHVIQVGGLYIKIQSMQPAPIFSWKKAWAPVATALLILGIAGATMNSHHVQASEKQTPLSESAAVVTPPAPQPKKKVSAPVKKQKRRSVQKKVSAKKTPTPKASPIQQKHVQLEQLRQTSNLAFEKGDYQKAFSLWLELFRMHPGDTAAVEGFTKLEKVAKVFLEEAMMAGVYSKEGTRLLKQVTSITHPQQRVYQVAHKQLQKERS
jgi:hypothetical protein